MRFANPSQFPSATLRDTSRPTSANWQPDQRSHVRLKPLGVLMLLAEGRADVGNLLAAGRGNVALACEGTSVDLEAVRAFRPDVILIDFQLPESVALKLLVATALGTEKLIFVGLSSGRPDEAKARLFDHVLTTPVLSCELEQLLWQISMQCAGGKSSAQGSDDSRPPLRAAAAQTI